jgi:hypothetical protein
VKPRSHPTTGNEKTHRRNAERSNEICVKIPPPNDGGFKSVKMSKSRVSQNEPTAAFFQTHAKLANNPQLTQEAIM